jgi:hypothetical protein
MKIATRSSFLKLYTLAFLLTVLPLNHAPAVGSARNIDPKVELSLLISNSPTTYTGSYTYKVGSTVREVQWRGSDAVYLVKSGGSQFGWAYTNQHMYERLNQPVRSNGKGYLWYDRGTAATTPAVRFAVEYPRSLARSVLEGASSVSKTQIGWVVVGNVRTEGYSTTRPVRSVIIFNAFGSISSVRSTGYTLTAKSTAPNPLVQPSTVMN